jgi:CMP-N,N'-diacetyllegionaminic acid synthase
LEKNNEKNIVAIIPARGGSKGIPYKNIIDFCGKPLIAWTIEDALQSKHINKVFVSTDDEKIARIAEKFGAQIIWRPAEFATDNATSESVLNHAISTIGIDTISFVVFLQATSPLRESSDIDAGVALIQKELSDSLFSGAYVGDFYIWKQGLNGILSSVNYDSTSRMRRQDFEAAYGKHYVENGSFYIFKPENILTYNNRLRGKISISLMELWKSFEIDDMHGLEFCKTLFQIKLYHKIKP